MKLKPFFIGLGLFSSCFSGMAQTVTVGFEDLASPPPLTGAESLFDCTGNGSSLYDGVVWDSRVDVMGSQYSIANGAPLFGVPESGNYYMSESGSASDQLQNITLGTTAVLTGGWFGTCQYYGYGGGAYQITINAVDANNDILGSVTANLPAAVGDQPVTLAYVNTSSFENLTGVAGYSIDHESTGIYNNNWIADDLTFAAATVPDPAPTALELFGGGMALAFGFGKRILPGGFPRRQASLYPTS